MSTALEDHALRTLADAQMASAAGDGWRIDAPDLFTGSWQLDMTIPPCPDTLPRKRDLVEAKLVVAPVARDGRPKMREATYTTRKVKDEIDQATWKRSMRESWYDGFAGGWEGLGGFGGRLDGQYVPLLPGPVTRQLYWRDYFAMSAKAFEAYNHDPITWRAVQLQQEFVLGKGVSVRAIQSQGATKGQPHEKAQAAWVEFCKRNKFGNRLDMMVRDWCVLGELLNRFFPVPGSPSKLTIRSLDPATIYDIITDPEDFETVFAYHQQFQTAYQLYAPSGGLPPGMPPAPTGPTKSGAITKYVIRQILPAEIDHFKLNVSASERRGRSDLYPSLTWIQHLRSYLTSKVVRSDMLARIVWDLAVSGNTGDIQNIRQQLFPNGLPPQPGTVLAHSDSAILTAVMPGQDPAGTSVDPTFMALANLVCLGPGVPVDYILQIMRGGTRANALVATEPTARRLEDRQRGVHTIIGCTFDRVMEAAGITDAEPDIAFPPIATEDITNTLQNLSFAESNQWLSKATAASRGAKILGIDTYDYEAEQALIDAEFEDPDMEDVPGAQADPVSGQVPQRPKAGTGRRTLIIATNRQASKLDPTKTTAAEDDPMGILNPVGGAVPPGGGMPGPGSPLTGQPGQPNVPGRPAMDGQQTSRGGTSVANQPNSAAGAKNIAARSRESASRIRPDDPAFAEDAEEYRRAAAANIAQLVRDSRDALRTKE